VLRRVLISCAVLLILSVFYLGVGAAMTWPMVSEMDRQVIGGGEFGGWLWRIWWHFQEIEATSAMNLDTFETLRHLVGLGRYPETGNVLDVLLISYPLEQWLGFPFHHNIKVLLILLGNGLCGYGLARQFTDSRMVAWAAGCVAVVNPLVIVDINGTGLRQVLLWWLLLFPISLMRATRTRTVLDGAVVGLLFTLVSAFYWFYGLFAAMFGLIWLGWWWWSHRPSWRTSLRWLLSAAVVASLGLVLFLLPYFAAGATDPMYSTMANLPELSFFLAFPSYDTVASAPLRPMTYEENVLSSLRRVIVSSWPADHVINPWHGVKAFPAVVFVLGVLPCLFIRRARVWLVVWCIFWVGTMGPFLKMGADRDSTDVIFLGSNVVRMPWATMFQWVPGMSRMFAPYRMSSMMVVASVVLLSIGLHAIRGRRRSLVAALAGLGVCLQPFWHIDTGPVAEGVQKPPLWRIPGVVSPFDVPDWYRGLGWDSREGIIELPLEQQQDLMCVYQVFHGQKLYRSWAGAPAVPPLLRKEGGGEAGDRLRWLAEGEVEHGLLGDQLMSLSRTPLETDFQAVQDVDLASLVDGGPYRWMIVHERGYYLVDPHEGGVLYRDAIRRVGERLNLSPVEVYEYGLDVAEDTHLTREVAPAWIPMAGKDVSVPLDQIPRRMMMAIFDLSPWREAIGDIELPALKPETPLKPGDGKPNLPPPPQGPPPESP
jgi:hypothetical protein